MALFSKLLNTDIPNIDWEMTPEYTFGTFESWGGRERVRSKNERIYYFFIDGWGETPKLCLMERGIKHARVVAEILAPEEMVRRCVTEAGKVALFERTYPIDERLKEWLIKNVIEPGDDSWVVPAEEVEAEKVGPTGLPGADARLEVQPVELPHGPAELSEEDVAEGGELCGQALGDDRSQVGLGVDAPVVVGRSVEMQRQTGDDQQGAVKIGQEGLQSAICQPAASPTGNRQVPVEPRVQQWSAINLDTELQVRTGWPVRSRLDLKARAVAVGRQHPEPIFGSASRTQSEGNESGVFTEKIIRRTGRQ